MARGRPSLTLIEAALLASLVALVLAMFVPSFVRRLETNKVSEAAELLGDMSRRASAYYDTSWGAGRSRCLPPSAGPTPSAPTVDATDVDFSSPDTEGYDTWQALGFQPDRPVRFSYRFATGAHGCDLGSTDPPTAVVFSAEGDLDGDDVRSRFELRATAGDDRLVAGEALQVHQRTE